MPIQASPKIRVSGLTILKNGVKYDYPFREAIASTLPLVDEMIVLLGDSEDSTEETLRTWMQSLPEASAQKIKIHHSTWDTQKKDGSVLSVETNKALDLCQGSDWRVYIQADECFHEQDTALLKQLMQEAKADPKVEALALSYHHFYGNYQVLNRDRGAYRHEVRIFKPLPGLRSFGDAQGFRFTNREKPKALKVDALVFHYGYVRPLAVMVEKAKDFDQLFHEGGETLNERTSHWNQFVYQYKPGLTFFRGTHPKVMEERIKSHDWTMNLEEMKKNRSFSERLLDFKISIENALPFRIGEFKNYRPIRRHRHFAFF